MVGIKIRDLRKKLGMTQEQLAGEELTKSYVSQVELGRIHPSHKALQVMAARLGKPMGYFMDNGDDLRTIEVLLKAAQALWTSGRLDDGMLGLQEALNLAERTGREDLLAHIRSTMGRLEMMQGNFPEAIRHLEDSLALIHPEDHPAQAVSIANVLATAQAHTGAFHKAMQSFQQALEYAKYLSDQDADTRAEAIQSYGDFCYSQNQWLSALEVYQKALAIPSHLLPPARHAELFSRVAACEWRLGQEPETLKAIEKAEQWLEQVPDPESRSYIQLDLGRVLTDIGRYTEAYAYLTQSIRRFRKVSTQEAEAQALEALLRLADLSRKNDWLETFSAEVLSGEKSGHWGPVRVYALRLLGRRAVDQGHLKEAEELFTSALDFVSAHDLQIVEQELYMVRIMGGHLDSAKNLWALLAEPQRQQGRHFPLTQRMPRMAQTDLKIAK